MSVTEEYRRRGGFVGEASRIFLEQIRAATDDSGHELRGFVDALQSGDENHAMSLLGMVLANAYENESSPLRAPALLFQLGQLQMVIQEVARIIHSGDDDCLEGMPQRIIQWASALVYTKNQAAKGGSNKAKVDRGVCIAEWEKYSDKKKGFEHFARQYVRSIERKNEDVSEKLKKKIWPTRTIVGWISAHEKNKNG